MDLNMLNLKSDSKKNERCKQSCIHNITMDIFMNDVKNFMVNGVLLVVLCIPLIYLQFLGQPYHRGFYCDDESLSYPYHSSTVPTYILYITGFGFPFITIVIVEALKRQNDSPPFSKLRYFIWTVFEIYLAYGFGAAFSQCLTDISKYSIGRLRPHFFAVCRPSYDTNDCGQYVTNYTCLGGGTDINGNPIPNYDYYLKDVHLSFVSGHASFSFQSSMFIILYLQAKFSHFYMVSKTKPSLLIPFIQVFMFAFSFFTSLSRVSDYKHHPTDVLTGAIIGILAQTFNVIFVMKMFHSTFNNKYSTNSSVNSLPTQNHCHSYIPPSNGCERQDTVNTSLNSGPNSPI